MERRNKETKAVVRSYRSCPTAPTKEIDRRQEALQEEEVVRKNGKGSQIAQMKTIDDSFRPAAN